MNLQLTDTQFKEYMAKMVALQEKHTPSSTTLTSPALHGRFDTTFRGPNHWGIFTTPGVRPERWTTLVRPNSLAQLLVQNMSKSRVIEEKLEVMTGVTSVDSFTNSTSWCGDPPTPGEGKVCKQNFNWGSYHSGTKLSAIPEVGGLRDRADVPAEILNAGPSANPLMPDIMFNLDDTESRARYLFWLEGVQFERTTEIVLVQGTYAAAANAHYGWSREFNGIDNQIKTGYTDADLGTTCPAMDSIVETFGAAVNSTQAVTGYNIVRVWSNVFRGLRNRARKMGMLDPQWAIIMREELFYALVDAYSCLYHLYACTGSQYEENNIDQVTTNTLRLDMQANQYLLVDNIKYPVIFSEGVAQTTPAANTFESDAYVLPISSAGAPLTRLEYFPMDNQYITEMLQFGMDSPTAINNGLWLVGHEATAFCKEWEFASKMRLILETPWLAARVDNIQYSFNAEIRNAIPGQSYYADGGVTRRL